MVRINEKFDCPRCKEGQLEKSEHLLKCNNCGWCIDYNQYKDLYKILDGKVFLEGEKDE